MRRPSSRLLPLLLTSALLATALSAACDAEEEPEGDDVNNSASNNNDRDAGNNASNDAGNNASNNHDHDAGVEVSPDVDVDDPAVMAYCDCIFITCHDDYHATFGEDELVAREGCLMAAAALPREEGATAGNSLECRQSQCDAAACEGALGESVCVE